MYTKEQLSQKTNDELDAIYTTICGYAPINDDGQSRDECIELILGMQDEIEAHEGNPQPIEHPFFENGCTLYTLPDGSAVFVYGSEFKSDLHAWYTGIVIPFADVTKFLNECQNDEHSTLGAGFCDHPDNIMKELKEALKQQKVKPSAHTPGPWKAEGWGNSIINDSNGNTLCAMPGAAYGIEIMKANARLIACAPEMLEALEELIRNHEVNLPIGYINRIKSIINKAKGN